MTYIYMYELDDFDYVKFGKTINTELRANDFKTHCPFNGRMVWAVQSLTPSDDEKHVRNAWFQWRVRNEWYAPPRDEVKKMQAYFEGRENG